MTSRRIFLVTFAGGILVAPLAAEAQQAGKVYRIGVLASSTEANFEPSIKVFREALRATGWVEGEKKLSGRAAPAPTRVLPMELQVGDRFVDANGEREVISRPYTANGGKSTHAHVRKVPQPAMAEIRTWGAPERISVKRATAEEGK